MGDFVVSIIKWVVRIGFVGAMIMTFTLFLNLIISLFAVTLNFGVLSDIMALVQLWLPFNLSVVIVWITTATFAYLTYRLAVFAYSFLNSLVGGHD